MDFEVDEEYEREGEYIEEDEECEKNPHAILEDASPGNIYLFPERSEEDLTSSQASEIVEVTTYTIISTEQAIHQQKHELVDLKDNSINNKKCPRKRS
jgi:hypothetical protein